MGIFPLGFFSDNLVFWPSVFQFGYVMELYLICLICNLNGRKNVGLNDCKGSGMVKPAF